MIKKLVLSLALSTLPVLACAQSGLTVFVSSDVAANFTVNGNSCEASNSCAIPMSGSVVLTETQLAELCGQHSNACEITFGIQGHPAPIGTAGYIVGDAISYVRSPQPCKFCAVETDKHTITVIHRVI